MKILNFRVMTLVSVLLAFTATADDVSAKAKLEAAKALYADRTVAAKVEEALTVLGQALSEATLSDLKYEILVFHSQTLYWKGLHVAGSEVKVQVHEAGRAKAEEAKTLNPDYADAYYWYAVNLGRWGEAKGILVSLGKKDELIAFCKEVLKRGTQAGDLGESYQGYGVDRTLGRLYYKLPAFAGGSLPKALDHLKKAFENAKDFAGNVNYLAEALNTNGETAEAKRILDDMLSKDPKTFNPSRVPETEEEFVEARRIRSELGN